MARKKVAQEACLFCGKFPCGCDVTLAWKLPKKEQPQPDTDRDDDGDQTKRTSPG